MAKNALEMIVARNAFYKHNFHKLLKVFFILCLINVILVFFVVEYKRDNTKPFYFATDALGQLLQLPPLSQAYLQEEEVTEWVEYVITRIYSYNFVNFRNDLQDARNFFTAKGYKNFIESLASSNNLNAVKINKLTVSAKLADDSKPIIRKHGVKSGRYVWIVRAYLEVTYENDIQEIVQPIQVDLLLTRVSRLNVADGIAIAQIVAQDR